MAAGEQTIGNFTGNLLVYSSIFYANRDPEITQPALSDISLQPAFPPRFGLSFINPSQFGLNPLAAERIESETPPTGFSQLSRRIILLAQYHHAFIWPATFGLSPFRSTQHLSNILSESATRNVTNCPEWSVVTLFGFIKT
jgi:hypothetical protein